MIWRNLGGLPLNPGHATVWVFPAETATLLPLLPRMQNFLSIGERAHATQITDERTRAEYVATRFLVRTLLSRAIPERAPTDWSFHQGEFGKPSVSDMIGISFNLSHTEGAIAAAVTVGHDIGIDIERVARDRADLLKVAPDYFSSAELRDLATSPDAVRRFYDLWAVKESYIKARGMGLDFRLQQVSFNVPPALPGPTPIPVHFAPVIDDEPADWKFFLFDDASISRALRNSFGEFALGLGVRTADPIDVACVEFVPEELA